MAIDAEAGANQMSPRKNCVFTKTIDATDKPALRDLIPPDLRISAGSRTSRERSPKQNLTPVHAPSQQRLPARLPYKR